MPFLSISARVQDSIQRSMCEVHFNGFTCFHNTIAEFGEMINSDFVTVHAHLLSFFPIPPSKVGKNNWIHFGSWLQYGIGNKIKGICLPWIEYGLSTIRSCPHCKQASVYVHNYFDDAIIEISSDGELKEGYDGDEIDDVSDGGDSEKTGLGCGSHCDCPTDCDEECECMMRQYEMQRVHNHNSVYMHVSSAVERSLCSNHYKGLKSFHENMFDFCSSLSLKEDSVRKSALGFFPNAPITMTILDWGSFHNWSIHYEYAFLSTISGDWKEYVDRCLRCCYDCRAAVYRN
ncbi:hypothetical protein FRX31_002196 [Thalictrum thalictroides]|uniref:Uncharacterized protein n=1 Tax=Thalictrum thalictroides TaxID=46969 RepID=A0A7J6XGC6_THATH|nr:hypothetical protein FRX31_002196 [Thalictrum thalictroides]